MTWFAKRFEPNPKKVQVDCCICGKGMWFPQSKSHRYKTCGEETCKNTLSSIEVVKRMRPCETCGKLFTPRSGQLKLGQGKYCSRKCNTALHLSHLTPESRAKSAASFKRAIAEGRYKPPTGPDHPNWAGGKGSTRERLLKGGSRYEKLLTYQRKLRKSNPDRMREYADSRMRRKFGRLPKGTVKAKGNQQGWLCVYCLADVSVKYHVDHIMPLALGGAHVPDNIQILCPTCNVRKSAKHPSLFTSLLENDCA